MKPLKNLLPLALWLLRISVLLCIISTYLYVFDHFNYKNINHILALASILSAAFLFIGGFAKKSTLTIIAGLLLCGLQLYHIYPLVVHSNSITLAYDARIYANLLLAATGLLFAAHGNN